MSAARPKKAFINDPAKVVPEMLEGLLLADPSRLAKLDGHNVIVRADFRQIKAEQVTIVTGGGSGHEPAFAGYVGPGLVTAAVCGGVFASPSASAVLVAIRAVCGPPGCLVVVMNYTGDRLNFGMAVEKAKAEGYKVSMLIVADDCALPRGHGIAGRRGVAGTVLVQKVAGAAAEAGLSLEEVLEEGRAAAGAVGTLGVALTTCTLPGQPLNDRLDADTIEIGLGIHGEPGMEQSKPLQADELTDRMIKAIVNTEEEGGQGYLPLTRGEQVVLLINDLGGTPPMELFVLARRAVKNLDERGAVVQRCYTGHFMTSLEMQGASLTLMRVDALRLARLDAPVDVAAPWRASGGGRGKRPAGLPRTDVKVPEGSAGVGQQGGTAVRAKTLPGERATIQAAIEAVAQALIEAEPDLTKWDSIVGDGDCGETFKRGAEALRAKLREGQLPVDNLGRLLGAIGDTASESMGGTIGAILEIFFTAAKASVLTQGAGWVEAFGAGVDAVKFYGGADLGMRTVLDALIPAAQELRKSGPGGFGEAVAAAEKGAERTKELEAKAGRSSYVSAERQHQVPDPGAKAMAIILSAVQEAL